ncbi:MAG: pyridoxal phosphate-dependent class II aminotransferase [Bacteroidales bacterium]|nr:pyridoxal phosphate-dependent class II aminotransferase [Bacteroidales bacterium]
MILGHGDDAFRFDRPIRANFSSNVYSHVDLSQLKEHLAAHLDVIGNYPEPEPYRLEAAIARRLGIDASSVCVTSGATEAIYLIAHAFSGSRSAILQPAFSEYEDACNLYGHSIEETDFSRADLFWFCNPNNPDGYVMPKEAVISLIKAHPITIFVTDQSYGFFTKEPLLSPAEALRYPNVLQLHSMTKRYAMPGLRLGYVTGCPELLDKLRAVRMPWSVNALAIEAGLYLAAHPDTAPIDLDALLAEAQRLRDSLNGIPGISVYPTQTHFMLCRMEKGRAALLKDWLANERGLLIRDASNFKELDEGCFRIASQTPEENDMLVSAIREWLEALQ